MAIYSIGEKVILVLGKGHGITKGLLPYKDKQFEVSRVVCMISQVKTAGNGGYGYELKGCVSPFGIPYTIHPDWLLPVLEEDVK